MGHNTCKWTTYILMPRVRATGMWERRNKGVCENSKHRVRGQQAVGNNYYKERQGWGSMETDGGFWSHHRQGGCLDAHQVLILAQNTKAGTDAQVHQLVIDGS